jgi:hypothetical protein
MQELAGSEGLDQQSIRQQAKETSQKASEMMQTYLGEDPDTLEALEFLCLAERGEVAHYESWTSWPGKQKIRNLHLKLHPFWAKKSNISSFAHNLQGKNSSD